MNVWHKTKRQAATISQSSLAKWFNKVNTDTLALTHTDTHTHSYAKYTIKAGSIGGRGSAPCGPAESKFKQRAENIFGALCKLH